MGRKEHENVVNRNSSFNHVFVDFFFGGRGFVLRRFQRCTGHITTGSWRGRENQYIQFISGSVL